MKERKTRYAVYNCNYHLVWIPKYRRKALHGIVKDELLRLFTSIAESQEMEVISAEVMPDHVHLFVSAPPRLSPSDIVNVFKGVTARMLRMKFPELKKIYSKGLWTRSYYVGTAGNMSAETIKAYIANQESHERAKTQTSDEA
jgi:putative transposase